MFVTNVNSLNALNINHYPNFKSTNVTLPAQKPDTVEISAENKKKSEMSTGMKRLLGLTGTATLVYAGFVGHRAFSRPTLEALQKDFTEIFRRNISKEEVPNILKNYKEIMKINDEKEFCEKAFEQVKKDYGYEKLNIKPTISDKTDTIFGGQWIVSGEAFLLYYKNIIEKFGGKFNKFTKAKILDSIFHEFQHVKQTEYCMRTNPQKFFEAIIQEKNITKEYINRCNIVLNDEKLLAASAENFGVTVEQYRQALTEEYKILQEKGYTALPELVKQIEAQKEVVKKRLDDLFGGFEKFKPDSKEYELGEKYINNFRDYIEAQKDSENTEYLEQIVEKEAFTAEDLSLNIPKRLKSIWNVFDNTNYNKLKIQEQMKEQLKES